MVSALQDITVQKTLTNVIPILVKMVATVIISCMGSMSVQIGSGASQTLMIHGVLHGLSL